MSFINFKQRKKKLRILILGPYRPTAALKRLERLKSCIIKRSFATSRLVKDFPNDEKYSEDLDEHFTIKSRKMIEEWADVPIFVFLTKADNLGVSSELVYTCTRSRLKWKASCSVVFFQTDLDISSQIRGSVKIAKISYEKFDDDKMLCDLAVGHCRKTFDRLFYYLQS